MKTECSELLELWKKYCKDKNYSFFSTNGNLCSSILQKHQNCLIKKKLNLYK
jgi:hypothetical protein